MDEQKVIEIIDRRLAYILKHDKVVFSELVQFLDGRNVQVGRGTGTSIGTAADQKLSVYGETPVVQASAISTPSTQGAVYNQTDANSIVTAVNSIITAIKNFGITA